MSETEPSFGGMSVKYFALIGVIASEWETLDHFLEQTVCKVLYVDQTPCILLASQMGFRSRIELIMAALRWAFEKHEPTIWKKLTKAIERINAAHSLRNTYVHARWVEPKNGVARRRILRTAGGRANFSAASTTLDELLDAVKEIVRAREQFEAAVISAGLSDEMVEKMKQEGLSPSSPYYRNRRRKILSRRRKPS